MKKWITIILSAMLMLTLCACSSLASENSQTGENTTERQTKADTELPEEKPTLESQSGELAKHNKILVAYFSATGTTKPIAENMAEILGADLYEIVPAQTYSDADLNYNDDSCRANQEQYDSTARPEISGAVENMEQYDIVLIGHPIWWDEEPRIMDTFMESYDWSSKTLVNFCTSGGSGINTASAHLKAFAPEKDWLEGHRFQGGTSEDDIKAWLDEIGISSNEKDEGMMYIKIKEYTLTVELDDNSSVEALVELLKDGDIEIAASDYGNFEKVGPLGTSLPTNDEKITTEPGDVILYQGNQITLYYDTNTWNFTRLGKVKGISQEELKQILGDGDVTLVLSLDE